MRDSSSRSAHSIELLRAIRDRKEEAITSSFQRGIAAVFAASLGRRTMVVGGAAAVVKGTVGTRSLLSFGRLFPRLRSSSSPLLA